MLALYGGMDRNLPGEQSANTLRAVLAGAGNQDATVHFYPDADHWMWRTPRSGDRAERSAKVEHLGSTIAAWLVSHAGVGRQEKCPP